MTDRQIKIVCFTALGAVFLVCLTLVLLLGSEDVLTRLGEGSAALGAWLVSSGLVAYALRDADGDGEIDLLQRRRRRVKEDEDR